jgi:hypothetical protein
MSRNKIEELRRYLKENLVKKFIRVNRSHAASLVMFVKKLEKKLRFYVDYRDLNVITIKNRYSLSFIVKILNRLSWVKIFTKIDIIAAFNRLRMKKEDEELIAFRIHFDFFEFLILSFEFCNKSIFFQHYINDTLREYLNDFCTIYLNDILIYNDNELEHEIHVKKILFRFRDAELQANIIKCKFHVTKIAYLELIVIIDDIKMNLFKIKIVINWLILIDVKNVQSFLKFANCYRRFMYEFSNIVDLLTNLIKKKIKFKWTNKCQKVFDILKKAFISDVVLRHFDSNRVVIMKIDAFDYMLSRILSQYDDQKMLYFIVYFFKKHNSVECNYEIYDKKLMIIVRCFEEWKSKLKKFAFFISVISNLKNLEYFVSIKQLSRRENKWSEFLSRFDFKIIYRSEKAKKKSNALTRRLKDLSIKKDDIDDRNKYQH